MQQSNSYSGSLLLEASDSIPVTTPVGLLRYCSAGLRIAQLKAASLQSQGNEEVHLRLFSFLRFRGFPVCLHSCECMRNPH